MLQTLQIKTHPSQFSDKKRYILDHVQALFAASGMGELSMRNIAQKVGVSQSVLYHYFENKDQLLLHMYHHANYSLGKKRKELPKQSLVSDQFRQLLEFQFEHAEKVVAVLKFYLMYRETFAQSKHKTLPQRAVQHIEEVITLGIDQGFYRNESIDESKVIAHSINGYLLEHFPYQIDTQQQQELVTQMLAFYERSLMRSDKVVDTNTTLLSA